ncbi:flavodoxin family protein [Candidatus Epulonipiscium viviparus]|uniref:flavodoxin family protein n=1 Tax=Candidatus Epulonipiscium viviparus TaxID=420336 RepID=UPI00068BD82F|nr:flavodoxin [Candidatus Epulopiscium viviparus]
MKTLVVYYSRKGNTKRVAEAIANELSAELFEIKPLKKYGFFSALFASKSQIKKGVAPPLEDSNVEMNKYNDVIVGTPVWWGSFAPPVRSFLRKQDLSRKPVRIFCTCGGKPGNAIEDLKNFIGDRNVKTTMEFKMGNRKLNQEKWTAIETAAREWAKKR